MLQKIKNVTHAVDTRLAAYVLYLFSHMALKEGERTKNIKIKTCKMLLTILCVMNTYVVVVNE